VLGGGVIEFDAGACVGIISESEFSIDSFLHSLECVNNGLFELDLLVGDLLLEFEIMAVIGSVVVAGGISEGPDEFLDVPQELVSEVSDGLSPDFSVGINTRFGSSLSGGEFGAESVNESIEGSSGSIETSSKLSLKILSGGLNTGITGVSEGSNEGSLGSVLFGNTFHGPVDGTLDEFIEVVDVLDVEVLSVSEDGIVVLNGNSLFVSSVSVSSSL